MIGFVVLATIVVSAQGARGYEKIDVNDRSLKELSQFVEKGVKEISRISESNDGYNLVKVISAERQVEQCEVVIYESLDRGLTATVKGCVKVKVDDTLRVKGGRYRAINVRGPRVLAAANWATDSINSRSNAFYRVVLLKVTDGKVDVSRPRKYHLTLKLVYTTCRNEEDNYGKTVEDCGVNMDEGVETCEVTVIDKQPRFGKLERYSLDQFSCTPDMRDKKCSRKDFESFTQKYSRIFRSQKEEDHRFGVFCENMKKIEELQLLERGSAVYGATEFADWTEEEFREGHVATVWDQSANDHMDRASIPKGDLPPQFDWRSHGIVTPVKNQGQCGSCWAFSTTGNIEGVWALKHKKLVSLSEQELVDCDKVDKGCEGGLPSNAYKVIMKLGGLETEKSYPYEGSDDKCEFNRAKVAVNISGSMSISQDEKDMAAWLFKNGPISIGINAFAMQFYFGGISHPWHIFCNPKSLDHGVLIVGYGVQGSEPFWIIKNSWGPTWGEKGYYRIYRGDGSCGLNRMCTSATVN